MTTQNQKSLCLCICAHMNIHVHANTHSNAHTPVGRNLNRDLMAFLLLCPPSIGSFLRMVLWSQACTHSSGQTLLCPTLVQTHPPPPCHHPHCQVQLNCHAQSSSSFWRPMTRGFPCCKLQTRVFTHWGETREDGRGVNFRYFITMP